MRRTRKHTVFAALVALGLLIVSCGNSGNGNTGEGNSGGNPMPGMKPTLTQQQATQRVDDYVQQALSTLPPAQLEDQEYEPSACDDPTDHGPKGRVNVSKGYMLWGLPKEQNTQNIDKVRQWALSHNFGILDDSKQPDQFLWMENKQDGFQVTIKESGDESKVMTLIVGSPCVWPNGTPSPRPQGQAAPDTADTATPQAAEPAASSDHFTGFDPSRFSSRRYN